MLSVIFWWCFSATLNKCIGWCRSFWIHITFTVNFNRGFDPLVSQGYRLVLRQALHPFFFCSCSSAFNHVHRRSYFPPQLDPSLDHLGPALRCLFLIICDQHFEFLQSVNVSLKSTFKVAHNVSWTLQWNDNMFPLYDAYSVPREPRTEKNSKKWREILHTQGCHWISSYYCLCRVSSRQYKQIKWHNMQKNRSDLINWPKFHIFCIFISPSLVSYFLSIFLWSWFHEELNFIFLYFFLVCIPRRKNVRIHRDLDYISDAIGSPIWVSLQLS